MPTFRPHYPSDALKAIELQYAVCILFALAQLDGNGMKYYNYKYWSG
jgi:hypothetical protein